MMKQTSHSALPDAHCMAAEWPLWTFSPSKRYRGNNGLIGLVIVAPLFLLMLLRILTLSEADMHMADQLRNLIWAIPALIAQWLLCKVLSRAVSGRWCVIHMTQARIFPGWRGAASKKEAILCCFAAPVTTVLCSAAAYWLVPAQYILAGLLSTLIMMVMLMTGVNMAFRLLDAPEHACVRLEGSMMRLYVPEDVWRE